MTATVSPDSEFCPQKIILHKISKTLEIVYADRTDILPAALLRAFSPDAATRRALSSDYSGTGILSVEPCGNYAIRLLFSDGHRSGIYSWETLRERGNDSDTGTE